MNPGPSCKVCGCNSNEHQMMRSLIRALVAQQGGEVGLGIEMLGKDHPPVDVKVEEGRLVARSRGR